MPNVPDAPHRLRRPEPKQARSRTTRPGARASETAPRDRPSSAAEKARSARENAANPGKPQSVVFTLLAEHLLGKPLAVFSGSFVDVLGRLGIGEHATRATLARMARRGLLARTRRGRRIYLFATPRLTAILEGGRDRIWHQGVINADLPAHFTLLTFSLPEAWQRKRYDLRARLTWAGFGPLQNGVWLAPAEIDVAPIIADLGVSDQVRVFHSQPSPHTDPAALVRQTFPLAAIAERYRVFCARWQPLRAAHTDDALSLTLRLSTDWLRAIRDDPRVPLPLLPPDWPAIEAQALFRALHTAQRPASEALARELLETVSVDGEA